MERITLAQFRDEHYDDSHDVGVYVVFNDVCCLYVGMSKSNVWNRWFHSSYRSHFMVDHTGHFCGNSSVAKLIETHMPQSWGWPIELWRVCDCVERLPDHIERLKFRPDRMDVRGVELLLINYYKPLLNRTA